MWASLALHGDNFSHCLYFTDVKTDLSSQIEGGLLPPGRPSCEQVPWSLCTLFCLICKTGANLATTFCC